MYTRMYMYIYNVIERGKFKVWGGGDMKYKQEGKRKKILSVSPSDRCCPVVCLNSLLLMIFCMCEMLCCLDDLMQRLPMPLPSEPTMSLCIVTLKFTDLYIYA